MPPRQDGEQKQPNPSAEHTYFFYGSLMDPLTFQGVTLAPDLPEYRDAWIEGYEVKMWGPYPALRAVSQGASNNSNSSSSSSSNIPATPPPFSDAKQPRVVGKVWVDSSRDPDIFRRLQRYETDSYEARIVTVHFSDGKPAPIQARAFVWAGEQSALRDGEFDLKLYQGVLGGPSSL
ncbi:hypothetical protein SODALDRAFT_333063 [Sodiomyces alkalinus F11]|uniref:Uncharacterized protein n=1 Tax=Sodiomyces alkalinus (strain CBS 110278 / VKM F-3762 / F11) TaxID=1314773 RepID=A0A3N2PVF0_SODAK|nr:hypothetical protein SODALDRAFT_333063 [Sodiomyces alkalinus F11]ROT38475.1 hypothetical protein SODALDRAFT_333063 [Sodiomyces alkalinus F11]